MTSTRIILNLFTPVERPSFLICVFCPFKKLDMSQRSISSFFKPMNKRVSLEEDKSEQPNKRVKHGLTGEEDKNCNNENIFPLEERKEFEKSDSSNIREELSYYSVKYPILDKFIGHSWFKFLQTEFDKPYFQKLCKFVEEERKKGVIYPPAEHVWSWTKTCTVDKVKVVILGQDPYHGPGQAHGLCFSVQSGVMPPPSLLNMYKELQTDIPDFEPPKHGHLIGWARQGVLLLNAVLTVKKGCPNSHKDRGWEELTTAVIRYLNERNKGIIFLLWGSYAQTKASFVNKKKHHVLKTVHPSPLSASKGFFGCKHFSKCNELLVKQGKAPIDWSCLPEM